MSISPRNASHTAFTSIGIIIKNTNTVMTVPIAPFAKFSQSLPLIAECKIRHIKAYAHKIQPHTGKFAPCQAHQISATTAAEPVIDGAMAANDDWKVRLRRVPDGTYFTYPSVLFSFFRLPVVCSFSGSRCMPVTFAPDRKANKACDNSWNTTPGYVAQTSMNSSHFPPAIPPSVAFSAHFAPFAITTIIRR